MDVPVHGEDAWSKGPGLSGRACPPLPSRDAVIERMAAAGLEAAFRMQGIGHNPHPPHRRSLSENVPHFSLSRLRRLVPEPGDGSQTLAFYANSLDSQDEKLIPLPRECIWCLLRPWTVLLLSDGRTQHYTNVHGVHPTTETLDLVDGWPDASFLREGLNLRAVAARVVEVPEGKLLRITRAEFERVCVSAVSDESPAIFEHILRLFPAGQRSPRFMLALALTAFGDEGHENPLAALPYFRAAFELTQAEPDSPLARSIVRHLHFATFFSHFWLASRRLDPEETSRAREDLRFLASHLLDDASVSRDAALDGAQLARLGAEALRAGALDQAEEFCDQAIERAPERAEGYCWRAKIRKRLERQEEAIADADRGIELLRDRVEEGDLSRVMDEDLDVYQTLEYLHAAPQRSETTLMFVELHVLRGYARNARAEHRHAEADGRVVIDLVPDHFQGYMIVAVALYERGEFHRALLFLQHAHRHATDPEMRDWMNTQMSEIAALAEETAPELRFGLVRGLGDGELVLVFRDAEGAAWLTADDGEADDTAQRRQLMQTLLCILPPETPMLALGEGDAGSIRVEMDLSLVSPTWACDPDQADRDEWAVRGFVPKSLFAPLPLVTDLNA